MGTIRQSPPPVFRRKAVPGQHPLPPHRGGSIVHDSQSEYRFDKTKGPCTPIRAGTSIYQNNDKAILPDGYPLSLRQEHRVFLGDIEGFIPGIDLGQRTVYAPFR